MIFYFHVSFYCNTGLTQNIPGVLPILKFISTFSPVCFSLVSSSCLNFPQSAYLLPTLPLAHYSPVCLTFPQSASLLPTLPLAHYCLLCFTFPQSASLLPTLPLSLTTLQPASLFPSLRQSPSLHLTHYPQLASILANPPHSPSWLLTSRLLLPTLSEGSPGSSSSHYLIQVSLISSSCGHSSLQSTFSWLHLAVPFISVYPSSGR